MQRAECMVQIDFSQTVTVGDDAADHLRRIDGKVVGRAAVGDREFDIPIGLVQLVYVDVGAALNRGIPLYDFFDYEAVVEDYCPALYDGQTWEFSRAVRRLLGEDLFQWNILILHRLKILPIHRGKKLGLAVLRSAIEHFSTGCGVVVAKPYPLQIEARARGKDWEKELADYRLDAFEQDDDKATRKLTSYYLPLGFKRLPKTGLLILNPSHPLPSLASLGCPEEGYYELEYQPDESTEQRRP